MIGDTTHSTKTDDLKKEQEARVLAPSIAEKRLELALGLYLLILPLLLTCLLVAIWPSPYTPQGKTVAELRSLWNFTDQVEV
ncbi:MAG: hypothetical protein LDL42_01775, partial [Rhizobium sp.]|nr:hypothetical protein [Rhizobium sp.]